MKPTYFELNVGESSAVPTPGGERVVRLLDVAEVYEPDYWVEPNPARRTVAGATVTVEVYGERATLRMRPYASPAEVKGLRLFVEATSGNACGVVAPLDGMTKRVRFSAVPAGESWGEPLRFPIAGYRWRSSTYMNTWGALVPYNLLYYHRGEDFGAIPDRLCVQAVADGEVVASPVPVVKGSNTVAVRTPEGLVVRMAHMNLESIDPRLTVGAKVRAGDVVGKTGMTWDSRQSQTHDPHLHVSLERPWAASPTGTTEVAGFPQLSEAYFREYPDALMAIAGGYHFAVPGMAVALDGSRSLARPGKRVAAWQWRLSDGRQVDGPVATISFPRPGVYAEEVVVRTTEGEEDRDFAQVRVYDPVAKAREIAFGWAYYYPSREIWPGTGVLFWNRIHNTRGPVAIDFGDGSGAADMGVATAHAYAAPGLYVATLRATGPREEPVTLKLRVIVQG